jgi:hypothetical protein
LPDKGRLPAFRGAIAGGSASRSGCHRACHRRRSITGPSLTRPACHRGRARPGARGDHGPISLERSPSRQPPGRGDSTLELASHPHRPRDQAPILHATSKPSPSRRRGSPAPPTAGRSSSRGGAHPHPPPAGSAPVRIPGGGLRPRLESRVLWRPPPGSIQSLASPAHRVFEPLCPVQPGRCGPHQPWPVQTEGEQRAFFSRSCFVVSRTRRLADSTFCFGTGFVKGDFVRGLFEGVSSSGGWSPGECLSG